MDSGELAWLEVATLLAQAARDAGMTVVTWDSPIPSAEGEQVFMRDAAYMVAIDRVVKAMELRGWL